MAYVSVLYTYDPTNELIGSSRPDHRAFIGTLHERGLILGSGPFTGPQGGALIVLSLPEGQGITEATALMDKDPFYVNGAIDGREFQEWNPVINSFGYVPPAS
ncbi:YciI family protein [Corynebacterium aquilae]|uniref:YCII-related domain-containing protein n=1 Tax=Corynebacterium aquilae DSM 44791 TaxID=1431546 RepID=A0A1L7CGE7_9CORY|nr:hypothetical protein [Corynebacterium aquilae]APT84940.1 hypothetical protein CAQU_07520 [Corynebacterium aquilae DSM 44791]